MNVEAMVFGNLGNTVVREWDSPVTQLPATANSTENS